MTREELELKAKESFNNKLQKDVCYCTYNEEKIYKDGYIAGAKAMQEENGRAKVLLKAVVDLLQKQKDSHYVLNLLEATSFYDEAECDGYCLFDDIENFLNNGS